MPRRIPGTWAGGVVVGADRVVDEGALDGAVAGSSPDQALVRPPRACGTGSPDGLAAALADPGTAAADRRVGVGRARCDQGHAQTGGRGAAAGVDPHLHAVGRCDDHGVGAGPLVRRLGGAGIGCVLVGLLRQGRPVAPDPARAGADPGGERPGGHAAVPGDPDEGEPRGAERAAGDGGAQAGAARGRRRPRRAARVAAGRAGTAAPRGTAMVGAVRLTVCTDGADGVGLRGGGRRAAGGRRCRRAVRVRASPEVDRSRRRRRGRGGGELHGLSSPAVGANGASITVSSLLSLP